MGNMLCRNTDTTTGHTCAGSSPTGATMTYDAQGRLSSWTAPSGTSASEQMLYDNEGNLVLTRTVTPDGNTSTIDFGVTETVLTSSTTTTSDYYFVNGQRVAEQVGSTFSYLIPNLEGSPTVALSSTGTVSAVQLFLPYGAQGFAWGTMPTPHNYTDQLLDSQSGLLYYGARWYDALADQFLSADSVQGDSSGMNPYSYVGGNPETATDPTGQRVIEYGGGGGGSVAAGGNILANAFPDGIPGYSAVGADVDSFEYDGATYTYNTSSGEVAVTASDYSYGYDLFPGEAGYGELLNQFKQAQSQADNPSDPFVGHEDSPVPTPMSPTTTSSTSPAPSPTPSPGGSSGGGPRPPSSPATAPSPDEDPRPVNSKGNPYPRMIDPRTGKEVPFPSCDLKRVPPEERTTWDSSMDRAAYIKQWYDNGYATPEGGWANYDIHHILPREFGGTNDFWNLVPLLRDFHNSTVTPWWNCYEP